LPYRLTKWQEENPLKNGESEEDVVEEEQ